MADTENTPKELSGMSDDQLVMFTKLFSQFDKTSLKLKTEFNQLQNKVDDLLIELDEKNQYLEEVYQKQQETNNLLFTLLKNLTSGVVLFDSDFKCILVNEQAEIIFGLDSEDFYDLSYEEIFTFTEPERTKLKDLQLEGKYKQAAECNLINKQKNSLPVYIKTSVLEDETTGDIFGYLYVLDDLSDLKKMEGEARKNKSFIEIGQMSAGIAHEIRNPLGGISGFATMLARDLKDDPEKLELVEKIREGVKSLNRITSDVLTFNRQISPVYQNVNPKTVIENCLDLIKSEISVNNHKIDFSVNFPATILNVDLDTGLLKQVLINILRNAVQALPQNESNERNGKINILLTFNIFNNSYKIRIKDNGCGIKKEDQDQLFTPFFTTKAEGSGLGLAVTRKIIETMNGEISLQSEVGTGTEFFLELPIKDSSKKL